MSGIVIGKTHYHDSIERNNVAMTRLANYVKLPYTEVDEESSTIEATDLLLNFQRAIGRTGHLHKQKDLKDGIASMIILQRFLNYYNKK